MSAPYVLPPCFWPPWKRANHPSNAQTEILAFNSQLPAFAALSTELLAISTDSEYSHLAWANTKRDEGGLGPDLKIKLVSDKSMKIARDYGVLLEVRWSGAGGGGRGADGARLCRMRESRSGDCSSSTPRALYARSRSTISLSAARWTRLSASSRRSSSCVLPLASSPHPSPIRSLLLAPLVSLTRTNSSNADGRAWRSLPRQLGPRGRQQERNDQDGSEGRSRVLLQDERDERDQVSGSSFLV